MQGFRTGRKLGTGPRGEVYVTLEADTNRAFAMKKISCASEEESEAVAQQLSVFADLEHPNIAECEALFTSPQSNAPPNVCVVTPYCEDGDLGSLLHRTAPLTEDTVIQISKQIANGLAHLHEQGLCHGNLHPCNVLLSGTQQHVLLVDMVGLRPLTCDSKKKGLSGMVGVNGVQVFTPPETLRVCRVSSSSSRSSGSTSGSETPTPTPTLKSPSIPISKSVPVMGFGNGSGTPSSHSTADDEFLGASTPNSHNTIQSPGLGGLEMRGDTADVWTFGCLMYTMLVPTEEQVDALCLLLERVGVDGMHAEVARSLREVNCCDTLINIILEALAEDPVRRPSALKLAEKLEILQETHVSDASSTTISGMNTHSPSTSLPSIGQLHCTRGSSLLAMQDESDSEPEQIQCKSSAAATWASQGVPFLSEKLRSRIASFAEVAGMSLVGLCESEGVHQNWLDSAPTFVEDFVGALHRFRHNTPVASSLCQALAEMCGSSVALQRGFAQHDGCVRAVLGALRHGLREESAALWGISAIGTLCCACNVFEAALGSQSIAQSRSSFGGSFPSLQNLTMSLMRDGRPHFPHSASIVSDASFGDSEMPPTFGAVQHHTCGAGSGDEDGVTLCDCPVVRHSFLQLQSAAGTIVAALQYHGAKRMIALSTFYTIIRLCRDCPPVRRRFAAQYQLPLIIMQVLKYHNRDLEVLEWGCRALGNLCFECRPMQVALAAFARRVISFLINLLEQYGGDSREMPVVSSSKTLTNLEAQEDGDGTEKNDEEALTDSLKWILYALANAVHENFELQTAFAQHKGAVDTIVSVMKNFEDFKDVIENACLVVTNLGANLSLRRAFAMHADEAPALVRALIGEKDDPSQEDQDAFDAPPTPSSRPAGTAHALHAALAALRDYSRDLVTVQHALMTLGSWGSGIALQLGMQSAAVAKALAAGLAAHSRDPIVLRWGLGVIVTLCSESQSFRRAAMTDHRIAEVIAEELDGVVHGSNPTVPAWCCYALTAMHCGRVVKLQEQIEGGSGGAAAKDENETSTDVFDLSLLPSDLLQRLASGLVRALCAQAVSVEVAWAVLQCMWSLSFVPSTRQCLVGQWGIVQAIQAVTTMHKTNPIIAGIGLPVYLILLHSTSTKTGPSAPQQSTARQSKRSHQAAKPNKAPAAADINAIGARLQQAILNAAQPPNVSPVPPTVARIVPQNIAPYNPAAQHVVHPPCMSTPMNQIHSPTPSNYAPEQPSSPSPHHSPQSASPDKGTSGSGSPFAAMFGRAVPLALQRRPPTASTPQAQYSSNSESNQSHTPSAHPSGHHSPIAPQGTPNALSAHQHRTPPHPNSSSPSIPSVPPYPQHFAPVQPQQVVNPQQQYGGRGRGNQQYQQQHQHQKYSHHAPHSAQQLYAVSTMMTQHHANSNQNPNHQQPAYGLVPHHLHPEGSNQTHRPYPARVANASH